ncbi:MAG: hypothetical protein VXZ54_13860 [Planctomycetota bacterium]|nr:hypothetical protein [Planctomycetota bacterium]
MKSLPAFVLRTSTLDSAAEPNLAQVFGIGSTLTGVAAADADADADNRGIITELAISLREAISSGALRRDDHYEDSRNAGNKE